MDEFLIVSSQKTKYAECILCNSSYKIKNQGRLIYAVRGQNSCYYFSQSAWADITKYCELGGLFNINLFFSGGWGVQDPRVSFHFEASPLGL